MPISRSLVAGVAALIAAAAGSTAAAAPDFPPFEKVSDGYREVTPADGSGLHRVWVRDRDAQVLAEIPAGFPGQTFYIAPTVAGGDQQTGVYSIWAQGSGMRNVYWNKYDRTLALVEPNQMVKASGDAESRAAVDRVYTDRVLFSTPIVAKGPSGGFVIDLDNVLLGQSQTFFSGFGRGFQRGLSTIDKIKVFPHNIELAFELPRAGGQLTTVHYSIGKPPKSPGFRPREADRRVGFFYTHHTDRSKNDGKSQKVRYIERWNLQKRDPSLSLSPPVKPIVYYIEHTTPVRYRRWVRDGILAWNDAFEDIGIVNAIEVRQQDAQTGAYMNIDPEDIRYSFVRWTNSHMGFAIGPSHAHPDTGEIFEADIVMDEGFISGWASLHLDAELAAEAMSTFDAETVAWLDENPEWDPRYRLAKPSDRASVLAYRAARAEGRAWIGEVPPTMLSCSHDHSATDGRPGCMMFRRAAANIGMARMAMDMGILLDAGSDEGHSHGDEECCGECDEKEEKIPESMLDGLPESFVGPLLKDVIMHEVGHTLGLSHNWKGSTRYTYKEINSTPEDGGIIGEKPLLISVMDYAPVNLVVPTDELTQGDWSTIDIGSYDRWAIEYGYGFGDPKAVATKAADPNHAFSSDEGQQGPDPHAKVWDIGSDTLSYAENRILFAKLLREKLSCTIVEDGESWEEARDAYSRSIYAQFGAANLASHWIGGAHTNKYKKGDAGAPDPITPVDVETQRAALEFILEQGFRDESYGLTPEILAKLGADQWWDEANQDQDWPIHDQVLGIQASLMTALVNPTRLRRVLDNETRVPEGEDALTVPELLAAIRGEVWSELGSAHSGSHSNREPMISSLRRNLQREHLNRLISIATGAGWRSASGETLASLARYELRNVLEEIDSLPGNGIDTYSRAHLDDAKQRIAEALEADYVRRG